MSSAQKPLVATVKVAVSMVELDFYDILGLARTALRSEIEATIKQQPRQWTKRASSGATYDRALTAGVRPAAAGDLRKRRRELRTGFRPHRPNWRKRATTQLPALGLKCSGMPSTTFTSAMFTKNWATGRAPSMNIQWVTDLRQSPGFIALLRISVLTQNNVTDEAIDMFGKMFATHSSEPTVRCYLTTALLGKAEILSQVQPGSPYAVTSTAEDHAMRLFSKAGIDLKYVTVEVAIP